MPRFLVIQLWVRYFYREASKRIGLQANQQLGKYPEVRGIGCVCVKFCNEAVALNEYLNLEVDLRYGVFLYVQQNGE